MVSVLFMLYNAMKVIQAGIATEHGRSEANELSMDYMALEVRTVAEGLEAAMLEEVWSRYRDQSLDEFVATIRELAKRVDMSKYRKTKGSKKSGSKKKRRRGDHAATARLLTRQREDTRNRTAKTAP